MQKKSMDKIQPQPTLPPEALLDAAYIATIATDRAGYLVYINKTAKSMLDMSIEDAGRVHLSEINNDAWIDFKKVIETGESQIAIPFIIKNREMLTNRTPILLAGKIVGVMCVFFSAECIKFCQHIKKYEKKLQELEAILDSSSDGIYVTDGNANTIRVSKIYEGITGLNAAEMIGRNMRDLVAEGYISQSVTLKVLEEKKIVSLSQKLKTGKAVLVTGNPHFDNDGNITMVVCNVRDMTELELLNQKVTGYQEMAEVYKSTIQKYQLASYKDNEIVKVSKAMESVYHLVERVSNTDATILLQGETGVGKDRIAEEIHAKSNRAKEGILVKINCGAIPEMLLESELFGYEKGAFTGAKKEGKPGMFEVADKGTLFLDEIETLPISLQGKLLRVLQDFEIRRLGGTVSKKVDVRLVCASNQELKEMVRQKIFRSDLYYRLNVIPINIPPLRERTEDIPQLIMIFLDRFNKQYKKNKVFSSLALNKLINYSWPGNVREVMNVIERLVVIAPGDRIGINDLPIDADNDLDDKILYQDFDLKKYIKDQEISFIRKAIKKYGNARKAAPHLGLDSSTLTRKLKKI